METPPTRLDAVRMVRHIRDAHYEVLKNASRVDRIAFYNGKVELRAAESKPAARPSV